MKRLKRDVLIWVGIGVFVLWVVYAACIPCQFFGWMPMPNVNEVLANPKPIHLVEISDGHISSLNLLCVHVSKAAFVKETGDPHGMMADLPSQLLTIQDNFEKSFKFFIDGWKKPVGNIAWSDIGPFIKCVDTTGESKERHVAYIQYNDVDGQTFSYTWVFEIKADGIVPELTATANP